MLYKVLFYLIFALSLYSKNLAIPRPYGYVNDFADIISFQKEKELEDLIRRFERATKIEIAVVTLKELGDESIEDVSVKIFEEWGIGKKGEDNGLLLLIGLKERKVRIEVGYGLEDVITDSTAGRILDEYGIPYFRNNKFDEGVFSTVTAIIFNISKKKGINFKVDERYLVQRNDYENRFSSLALVILVLIFIIFFRFILWFMFPFWFFGGYRAGRGFWSSGGFGGFSSGFGGFGGGMSGGGGATRGF